MSKAVNASESKERLEHKGYLGRSLNEFVLDEHLIVVRNHHDSLGEYDSTNLISDNRHRIGIKVNDVLMSFRLIHITIAVNTEVELFATHHEALVERRKQHKLSTAKLLYRHCKQSVVLSRIASHNGCVAVRTGLVRRDQLTLQRVLEVDQFGLVEFQKSHI